MLRTVASAAAGLGVERLDQAQQTRPRHDLIHLGVIAFKPEPAIVVCESQKSHNEEPYDLFIGEVEQAWADTRVFRDGHWHFERAPSELRCLH
ncbi:hypothetical protein JRG42_22375 [Pseudomonas granadensis]|uniref:Uncharacterized protein n=1 Tax=Pseudomonas granadensis TaxID=1421430 RepID=A0ABX7GNG8_9PSED|nr:hypothetical protein [Pseudomonas granadensis]OJT29581.1 hypothetical protein BOP96_15795 [Pseudomonas sp. FSL W5-0203]MBN6807792.1 hypothetical protein [Pseudomonas granadensis]MBN6833918.1 hypothetical protein [Pseudomonas granadensis]MBN6841431.1 hypothetical protein [Pseudomonas granadensis]